MKASKIVLTLTLALLLSGCGQAAAPAQTVTEQPVEEVVETVLEENPEETAAQTAEEEAEKVPEGIAEAIEAETSYTEEATESEEQTAEAEDDKSEREATAEIGDKVPPKYTNLLFEECGSIEEIEYPTYDYAGDGEEITKKAYVYLPAGYSENKQYNVMFLMHGIGGDETEWGMTKNTSRVKAIMDNLTYFGDIEGFIVVTPNGRSTKFGGAAGTGIESFYLFGQELRNDLIPYMDSHYSTYGEYDENGYDLSAAREHRAMAGLSMGGMQTINIGIGECLDCIGYFGAFSAAPTSNKAVVTAKTLDESEYDVLYFYNICGIQDTTAYSSASAAAKTLPTFTDKVVEGENFMWQELSGGHDFHIWYLGFYNFAQIAFQYGSDAQTAE